MWKRVKEKIFSQLEHMLPYGVYKSIRIRYSHIFTRDKREEYYGAYFYKRTGRAKEKYCIFRFNIGIGVCAIVRQYIFLCEWAEKKGLIPIIDHETMYEFSKGQLGTDNRWEYVFEQPLSIRKVLEQEWVLVEEMNPHCCLRETCQAVNGDENDDFLHLKRDNWREYYKNAGAYYRKWIKWKPELAAAYEKNYGSYMKETGHKWIGVCLREEFSDDIPKTDDRAKKIYAQHPYNLTLDESIILVKKYIEKWKCRKIFLSTQYQNSVDAFIREFGEENVVYVNRDRFNFQNIESLSSIWGKNEKEASDIIRGTRDRAVEITTAYMQEILGLSQCNYLIAASGSGAAVALALNGGQYDDIYILPDKNDIKRY